MIDFTNFSFYETTQTTVETHDFEPFSYEGNFINYKCKRCQINLCPIRNVLFKYYYLSYGNKIENKVVHITCNDVLINNVIN